MGSVKAELEKKATLASKHGAGRVFQERIQQEITKNKDSIYGQKVQKERKQSTQQDLKDKQNTTKSELDTLISLDRELRKELENCDSDKEKQIIKNDLVWVRDQFEAIKPRDICYIEEMKKLEAQIKSHDAQVIEIELQIEALRKEKPNEHDKVVAHESFMRENSAELEVLNTELRIVREEFVEKKNQAVEVYEKCKPKLILDLANHKEKRERYWWASIDLRRIDEIVEKLNSVSKYANDLDHGIPLDIALHSLFKLPAEYEHLHGDRIHEFLYGVHSDLFKLELPFSPLLVAHIAYLFRIHQKKAALLLIAKYSKGEITVSKSVADYLSFIADDLDVLSGTFFFTELSQDDVYLGSLYSGKHIEQSDTNKNWNFTSFERDFRANYPDERELNRFKVEGLQPRIAELVFHKIYQDIYQDDEEVNSLQDLNLRDIYAPYLPSADFENANGVRYDVKSNLYYRSYQEKMGLRGFLIKISSTNKLQHRYPGIVITETDDNSVSWTYIGEFRTTESDLGENRVLPFCFLLPDTTKYIIDPPKTEYEYGSKLLHEQSLWIGWSLSCRNVFPPIHDTTLSTDTAACIESFIEYVNQFLTTCSIEFALWKALTESTLSACGKYDRESVRSYLDFIGNLIMSGVIPIKFPKIENEPLILRWVSEVLVPLSENWNKISCTKCGCSASEPNSISIAIDRMTSQGSIEGRISCLKCNHVINNARLLTHCHKCNHYPLLVGKNLNCEYCHGLICNWHERQVGQTCGHCKKDCERGSFPVESL
jgi:hypothetical protein